MDLAKITDGFVKQETTAAATNTGPTPELSPVTPSKECEKRPRSDSHDILDSTQTHHSLAMSTPDHKSSASPPGLSHFAHLMQKSDTMYRQNLNSDQYMYSDEEKEAQSHHSHSLSQTSVAPSTPQYAFISHSITSYPSNEPQIDNARLARRKRRRTSPTELALLEQEFARNQKPPKHIRVDIARRVDMTEKAVQVWFQNKRQSVRKSMSKSMTENDTSFAETSFAHETSFDDSEMSISVDKSIDSKVLFANKTAPTPAASSTTASATPSTTSADAKPLSANILPPSDSEIASVAKPSTFSVFEDTPETPAPKKKPTAPRLSMRGGKATVIYGKGRRLGLPGTPSTPALGSMGLNGGSPLATSSPMAQKTQSQLNKAPASPVPAFKSKSFATAEEGLAASLKKRLPSMHYDLPVTNKTSSLRQGVSTAVDSSREAECISNLLSLRNGGRW